MDLAKRKGESLLADSRARLKYRYLKVSFMKVWHFKIVNDTISSLYFHGIDAIDTKYQDSERVTYKPVLSALKVQIR